MFALCLRAVLISSPGTWDWTRMYALVVMQTDIIWKCGQCQNKGAFFILQISIFYAWHRCIVSSYIVSIYRWIVTPLYDSMFQFLPISSNFAQPLKRSGPTSHRPQSTTWSTLCEGDVLHCVRQMVVTPDTDWFSDPPPPKYSKTAHFRVAFYCGQHKAHLCNNHVV